jgi:hypothetical protein
LTSSITALPICSSSCDYFQEQGATSPRRSDASRGRIEAAQFHQVRRYSVDIETAVETFSWHGFGADDGRGREADEDFIESVNDYG